MMADEHVQVYRARTSLLKPKPKPKPMPMSVLPAKNYTEPQEHSSVVCDTAV